MKKLCWFLTILLCLGIPAAAWAEESSGDSPAAAPADLRIDDANIYEGMDKPYSQGYTPVVKNGVATVIVPLISSAELKNSQITASPSLGEPASSPFVFSSYQKTIPLQANPVNGGGATVSSYYVSFDLKLSADRVNGVYPISINVSAQALDGTPVSGAFTSYVTVTDGQSPADPNAVETVKPSNQPKLIVSGSSITPSPVQAGAEFTAKITLKNTSAKYSVQNIKVTANTGEAAFVSLNESDTHYFSSLKRNGTLEFTLKYKAGLNIQPGQHNIALTMEYDGVDSTALTGTGNVPVEVVQPLRVEMEQPQIAEEVNAGDTLSIPISILNMGRSKVYNARCELKAPGLFPSGSAFVGNLEPGTAGAAALEVFVGTKNMSDSKSEERYGIADGTFTLIYEDEYGQEFTDILEFRTNIIQPVIQTNTEQDTDKQGQRASLWWISIVIGGMAIAGLAVFLVLKNKRRHHNEEI